MEYSVHGPFELIKQRNGLVDRSKKAKTAFWNDVEKSCSSLPSACGCYLFAIRAAKGIKPWYVGLASEQAFEEECFSGHKINIYNDVLANKKGTPLLFFVASRTRKRNDFVRPGRNNRKVTEYLEAFIIGAALKKNSALMNIKNTNFSRNIRVPGLINPPQGRQTQAVIEFKKALG